MEGGKARAAAWFRALRDDIVEAFEAAEDAHVVGPGADLAPGRFELSETRRASDDGSDAGGGAAGATGTPGGIGAPPNSAGEGSAGSPLGAYAPWKLGGGPFQPAGGGTSPFNPV